MGKFDAMLSFPSASAVDLAQIPSAAISVIILCRVELSWARR